jgi:hypothetical protein
MEGPAPAGVAKVVIVDDDRLAPAVQRAGYVLTPYQLDHRPALGAGGEEAP